MANKKITDLTELTSVDDLDELEIVDKSDTTDGLQGTSKRIKKSNLIVAPSTAKTTPVGADLLTIWDSAASFVAKKLSFTNLLTYLDGFYKTWILGINTISGTTYQIGLTDYKTKNVFTSATDIAFTVPTNAVEAIPIGTRFSYSVEGTGWVTISGAVGITFVQKNLIFKPNYSFFLEKIDTNKWVVDGGLVLDSKVDYNTSCTDGNFVFEGDNISEELIIGTAVYNATLTGATNIDLNSFSDYYGILTGNTTITFTNTPASGKTVSKTMYIKSTTTQTLTFADMDYEIGTYLATGVLNAITVNVSNFPTAGLIVRITYEEA